MASDMENMDSEITAPLQVGNKEIKFNQNEETAKDTEDPALTENLEKNTCIDNTNQTLRDFGFNIIDDDGKSIGNPSVDNEHQNAVVDKMPSTSFNTFKDNKTNRASTGSHENLIVETTPVATDNNETENFEKSANNQISEDILVINDEINNILNGDNSGTNKEKDKVVTHIEEEEIFPNLADILNMNASHKTVRVEEKSSIDNNSIIFTIIQTDNNLDNVKNASTSNDVKDLSSMKDNKKLQLFTEDNGPFFYNVQGNVVTEPIITKNLPKVFKPLGIFGKPKSGSDVADFQNRKLKEFVGLGLGDEEYDELAKYCDPSHLRTGKEMKMDTTHPVQWVMSSTWMEKKMKESTVDINTLNLRTLKRRMSTYMRDNSGVISKRLKYRSLRLLSLHQTSEDDPVVSTEEPDLMPGEDMLFRVRIYRPFFFNACMDGEKRRLHRQTLLCDLVVCGRQPLSCLRDAVVCSNDAEMRCDVAGAPIPPDMSMPMPNAKEVFPSGFLFINNVFYVDTREGCVDYSAPIREWAQNKGLGSFPHRDMCSTTLDQIVLKLGHPEVYVHQGNCEHIFTFSEIRLLNASDPLHSWQYPCHSQVSVNQLMNCNTCAEFSAKWLVSGCERVPFDPAMFCDTCFRQYLYRDGEKLTEFKAYRYRGNEINVLRPQPA